MACRVFKLNQIRQCTGFLVFFAFLCVAGMYYRTFYTNELLITTQQLSDIEGHQSHVLNMPLLEKLHQDLDNIMSGDGVNMTRLNAYVKQIKELKLQNVLAGQAENQTDSIQEYSEEEGSEEDETLNDYDEDDEEGELEARMEAQENSKANKTVNKRLVLEYDNPLLTTCEVVTSPPRFMRKPTVADPQLGYEECRKICKELDEEWAMLQRGGCYCYHLSYSNPIIDLEQCDATCETGDTTCVLKAKPHSITMRTGTWDGYKEWTVWMSNKELDVRVRYKDCLRHKDKETDCRPTIQRQSISDQSQPVTKTEAQMLLGCFTALTVLKSPSIKAEKVFKNRPQSHMYCRDFCGNNGAPYAFLESAITKKDERFHGLKNRELPFPDHYSWDKQIVREDNSANPRTV